MRISLEVKQAVRAVCEQLQAQARNNQELRRKEVEKWIQSTPSLSRLFKTRERLKADLDEVNGQIESFGLSTYRGDINDSDKAADHGFKFVALCAPSYDHVIARLARAKPSELNGILAELGINWA